MVPPNASKVQQLRGLFEGRRAIYIEKGALHVKVRDIRGDLVQQCVSAQVEEIPTDGFPTGSYGLVPSPRRWEIEAGYLTSFSDHTWHMGYGGWSLFFAPRIVEGILSLALRFPDNLDSFQRYTEILRYLHDQEAYAPTERFFPPALL